jgi:hypothetical protein
MVTKVFIGLNNMLKKGAWHKSKLKTTSIQKLQILPDLPEEAEVVFDLTLKALDQLDIAFSFGFGRDLSLDHILRHC